MGIIFIRAIILALITAAGYFYPPFNLSKPAGAAAGLVLGILIIWTEARLRRLQFRLLWTGTVGILLGVLTGWLVGSIYQSVFKTAGTAAFIRLFSSRFSLPRLFTRYKKAGVAGAGFSG